MLKISRAASNQNTLNQSRRENSWNDIYTKVPDDSNIIPVEIKERILMLFNDKIRGYNEYFNIIEKNFINKDISKKKIVELACGTAPIGFFFRNKFNKEIICRDFSKTILDRLKNEHNFNTIKSDISNLSNFEDRSIDFIFLGGGFYENSDPYFFSKVFSSLSKKIKADGKIYIFMNRHMSLINLRSYIQSLYFVKLRPQSWNWIRKIFNKRKIKYETALYLYSAKFISKVLPESNLKCRNIHYVGHALGLREFLLTILTKNLATKLEHSNFFVKISNYLKKKQINLFSTRCVLEVEKLKESL